MVRAADKSYDAKALEARVSAYWNERDAYMATRAFRADGQPWYFLDGPPYATGHIHMGTARNKVLKDVQVRHMRQRGFNVRDQPGYDMHGLPIEVKVEKEMGFGSKKDIEQHGIENFVEACRKFAVDHLRMMNDEFQQLGVWMDWDEPYMTIRNEYIEGAWWAIQRAHERELLFESERVLTWCWRCETALANAEVEFEDRVDPSIYVKFPIEGRENESLVIWTTTPWTIPANVAIAAHPSIRYARVLVRKDGKEEHLIVAAEQAENVARIGRYERVQVLNTFTGAELEGMRYRHPLQADIPYHQEPASEWNSRVILGDHVAADRTGLVHTATGHGVEDFEAGKRYGIPVFSPVGEDGRYTEAAGRFKGLAVKGEGTSPADAAVIERLAERGALVSKKDEKHAYGHCWRCKNPIIYRATKQWFINVGKIQPRMIEEVKHVSWTPEWAGSARQLDWVENARDWCISRQRYWGIPLPVWRCTASGCDTTTVIGSRKELVQIGDAKPDMDLHRPYIDKVRVACHRDGCGGVMKRVPDVLDVWFDSAVASWASLGWPSDKQAYEKWFPAAWICEGLDQTRGWFYSQLAAGVAAMDRVPYERVVMHGWVLDENGRAMSKSLGNNVEPRDLLPKFGADALRFGVLSGAAPWEDISFGTDTVRGAQRAFNILWNVHVFATGYMAADKFEPVDVQSVLAELRPEDRWLVSRLQTTVAETTHLLDAYEFHKAAREIEAFILEDLSRWYVRLVRERVWDERPSRDKTVAQVVLHEALLMTAKLMAPFAPYIAEAIYQDLTEGRARLTVHMEDWPVADGALADYDLEHDMAAVRAAVDAAAYARQKANMKLRWPVAKLVFATDDADVRSALMRFQNLVLEQANAKEMELVGGEWEALHLQAVPNKAFIGKTYRQDGPAVIKGILALDQATLRDLRMRLARGEGANVDLGGFQVHATREMLGFETTLPEGVSGADFPRGSVYVDTEVTLALQAEGSARDLTRRIQEMRKLLGLPMNATIHTSVKAPQDFRDLVASQMGDVANDTRSMEITFTDAPQGALVREWDLEGTTLVIGIDTKEPAHALAPPAAEDPAQRDAREAAEVARKKQMQTRLDSNEPAPADVKPRVKAKKTATKKRAPKKATRNAKSQKPAEATPHPPPSKAASAGPEAQVKKTAKKKATAQKGVKKATKKASKKGSGKKATDKKPASAAKAKKAAPGNASKKAAAPNKATKKGSAKSAKKAAKKPAAKKAAPSKKKGAKRS